MPTKKSDRPSPPTGAPNPKDNKHDGTGNPELGEQTDFDPNLAPNVFPRYTGSDSAEEFAGSDFAG